MDSSSSPYQFSSSGSKGDSVSDLLASVEKIKMTKTDKPLNLVFDQTITTANLREKFLYTTFEIIADLGADALSANELIKRTKSSKGALFHHFDTIDHLCVESLHFFRKHLSLGLPKDDCQNLEEYLQHFFKDSLRKQSTKQYVHLVNFFRDRAIRDERYREPLKLLFEVHMNHVTDRIMQFVTPGANRADVFNKVVFMSMTIERTSFHRVLYQNFEALQAELLEFMDSMLTMFKKIS